MYNKDSFKIGNMLTVLLILVFILKDSKCLNYTSVIQSSVLDLNATNTTLSAALAVDSDISTYTQTKTAVNNYWRINFTNIMNISCFTIISNEGIFRITIASNKMNSEQVCDTFSVVDSTQKENIMRCCQRPVEGDSFVITRTDMGMLQLYEVIMRNCSDENLGFSCDRCKQCTTCDAANGMCLSCPPFKYGRDCALQCQNNCSKCDIKNGMCKFCSRCAGNCNLETETCDSCKPGFFRPPFCFSCNYSIKHCWRCSSSQRCDKCVAGYHGPRCKKETSVTSTIHTNISYDNHKYVTTATVITTTNTKVIENDDFLHKGILKDAAYNLMDLKYDSVLQSSVDHTDMISNASSAIFAVDSNILTYTQTQEAVNNYWKIIFAEKINITCFTIISSRGKFKINIASSDVNSEQLCDAFSVDSKKESVTRCCQNQTEGTSFVVYREDNGKLKLFEVSLINCSAAILDAYCEKCTCDQCTTWDFTRKICLSCFPTKCKQACQAQCAKNCSGCVVKDIEISTKIKTGNTAHIYETTEFQIKTQTGSNEKDGSNQTYLTAGLFGVTILFVLLSLFVMKRSHILKTGKCRSYNQSEVIRGVDGQTHVFSVPQNFPGDEANSIFLEEITDVNIPLDEKQRGDVEYTNTTNHRISVDTFIDCHRIRRENNMFEEGEFSNLPIGLLELHKEALKKENIYKNRYRYVYPYDFCRVVLSTSGTLGGNDYINACYIEDSEGKSSYIAAQVPFTPLTLIDFWRMVWQENCSRIVMLTNLCEGDNMKCLKYWPEDEIKFGNFAIRLDSEDIHDMHTIRYLVVQQNKQIKNVRQFHFTGWPDCGVPSQVDSLLCFRDLVKNCQPESDGPIIVHCSAGIGRTGTFIALDYLLEEGSTMESVDIINCVSKLRQQRAHSIQTKAQYIFLYDALAQGLKNIRRKSSHHLVDEI